MPKTFRKLAGACARLEGWGRAIGFALMLRDASQRIWAVEAPALASRCDAPQHEGDRLLSMRAGGSTNLGLCEMMAGAASLFPACSLQGMVQLQRVGAGEGPLWHHPR